MVRFPNEKILSDELCKVTEALEAKDVDSRGMFLKGTCHQLTVTTVSEMLNLL